MKYYEIGFNNDSEKFMDSICIRGEQMPTIEEAEVFCAADMKMLGATHVTYVEEISEIIAESEFSMEDIKKSPVFGQKGV